MNIKEAEALSGVSRRNIRFYEQKGLLKPDRNRENDYREYSDDDIETLKLIRALRMLDMPVEQIREVVAGKKPLNDAVLAHKEKLKKRLRELETALHFCDAFTAAETLNIDEVLCHMDEPENREKLSKRGERDYAYAAIRWVLYLTAGLIPCFAGLIFGLIAVGSWFDLPVLSYLMSFAAILLWGSFGYWLRGRGVRPWETVLIHLLPVAACVCYVLNLHQQASDLDLFVLGCYFPIMATFVPFSSFAGDGIVAMIAPMVILLLSFLVGYLVAVFTENNRKPFPVGWIIFGASILVPVVAIIAGIFFTPLPTIATSHYLEIRLSSGAEVWVEEREESYEVAGSPEFSDLFRLEEWERELFWNSPGEPILEVHMHSDRTEPYAIEFYEDGTVRVYESWVTTQAGYFRVPDGLADTVLEYAEENGTLQ